MAYDHLSEEIQVSLSGVMQKGGAGFAKLWRDKISKAAIRRSRCPIRLVFVAACFSWRERWGISTLARVWPRRWPTFVRSLEVALALTGAGFYSAARNIR